MRHSMCFMMRDQPPLQRVDRPCMTTSPESGDAPTAHVRLEAGAVSAIEAHHHRVSVDVRAVGARQQGTRVAHQRTRVQPEPAKKTKRGAVFSFECLSRVSAVCLGLQIRSHTHIIIRSQR